MHNLNSIIIVEGKSDTNKLKKIFGNNIKTLETNGLNLNDQKLNLIKELSKTNKIIIFTDPDGPGKKIREQIINFMSNEYIYNAFIKKEDIKNNKKIGIAEANENAIRNALDNLIIFNNDNKNSISWNEYINNDFYLKKNRIIICKHNNWDYSISSKTFYKWLNLCNYNVVQIKEILENNNEY